MDLDNDNGGQYRPFSPLGANPMIPAATEEDVTYIVGKNNQGNKIVENRKLVMGITRQEEDDPTIIGVRGFNAGIQQRDMPDITVEITQIAAP